MNARLKKSFGFYSGLVLDGRFMVNHYNVEFCLLTISDSHLQQNIAYERMKYCMHRVFDDSLFIADNDKMLKNYLDTGARCLVLPDEPVDQIIGIMLYLKLNAIMESRMVVTDVEIWSTQGDSTSYLHSSGENVGLALSNDGWWADSRPVWSATRPKDDGKVISLDRAAEWQDFGLGWETDESERHGNVLMAKFGPDENK